MLGTVNSLSVRMVKTRNPENNNKDVKEEFKVSIDKVNATLSSSLHTNTFFGTDNYNVDNNNNDTKRKYLMSLINIIFVIWDVSIFEYVNDYFLINKPVLAGLQDDIMFISFLNLISINMILTRC